MITCFII